MLVDPTLDSDYTTHKFPLQESKNTVFDKFFAFTEGGVAYFDEGPRAGYYGWMGYGGSVFQWEPELNIGFAYTCTLLAGVSCHLTYFLVSG